MGGPGSGGRRLHGGTPPDPQALRRQRDGKEWTKLPATGRTGPAPEWPLAVQPGPNDDEDLKWRELWTLPQALVWEQDRCYDLVAFYVRTYLEAMRRGAGAQARTFVRQVSNDLYLAPAALAQGRYVIEGSDEAKALEQAMATHPAAKKTSARDRLQIVKPDEPEKDEPETPDDERPPF